MVGLFCQQCTQCTHLSQNSNIGTGGTVVTCDSTYDEWYFYKMSSATGLTGDKFITCTFLKPRVKDTLFSFYGHLLNLMTTSILNINLNMYIFVDAFNVGPPWEWRKLAYYNYYFTTEKLQFSNCIIVSLTLITILHFEFLLIFYRIVL